MFVIRKGAVRVTRRAGEHDIELALVGRGEFLGGRSLPEGLPRDADASVGPTRVLALGRGGPRVRIRRDPTFAIERGPRVASGASSITCGLRTSRCASTARASNCSRPASRFSSVKACPS